MEEIGPSELNKVIRDLSESSFRHKRYNAAVKLGKLPESSEDIVRVLAAAVALDDDVDVRSAAMQALQSLVHQAYLKDRPDFIREATQAAVQSREREKWEEEQSVRSEFLRRRTQQRTYSMIFAGVMSVSCILFIIGVSQEWLGATLVHIWQVVIITFAFLSIYLSWRNWRCPACDAWLSGFTFNINPIWSPDIVRCPHCGKRLL